MLRNAILSTGLLLASGCATVRSDFAQPNGQPLGVYDQTRSYLYNVDVKTGSVRNAQGQEILATYRKETRVGTERVWFGMQGPQKIDEESFYRIGGDQEAVARYNDFRQGGVTINLAGWITGVVGLAAIGGGLGMAIYGKSTEPPNGGTNPNGGLIDAGAGLLVGGLLVTIAGFSLVYSGKVRAENKDERLIGDPERMKAVAKRYNDRLFQQEEAEEAPPPPVEEPPPPPRRPRRR